ncbi:hypothetical protein PRIPAC_88698 [Pristionchus pacificus]|uniref:Uncharacterized protein n=1 Tax=Pristionchus pacificus TaxID=54126 RepID=A0A2A6B7N1_PRIPA|nr:hypothetical protein PRIPAC_88698 [Pristionchus pacificus]|eukprot:PDM61874.1 hypothetical protein PRIPAC_51316 [Pristionchus pacificus]
MRLLLLSAFLLILPAVLTLECYTTERWFTRKETCTSYDQICATHSFYTGKFRKGCFHAWKMDTNSYTCQMAGGCQWVSYCYENLCNNNAANSFQQPVFVLIVILTKHFF